MLKGATKRLTSDLLPRRIRLVLVLLDSNMNSSALRLRRTLSLLSSKNSSSLPKPNCISHLDLVLVFPLAHHFSTSASAPDPTLYEFLVHTHHFSPESASQIASVLSPFSNPERCGSILSYFKETGFSTSQLEKTLKVWPRLLAANLDRVIKPKVKFFHDLGLSGGDFAKIVTRDPIILTRSLNNRVIPNVSVLNNFLGSEDELARFLKASAWYLFSNLDDCLLPNVQLLRKCGVSMPQILAMMHSAPRVMLLKHEHIKKLVARADELGVSRSSKMFVHAVRVLASMTNETWESKMQSFREVGFSDDDIAAVFRKSPFVLALSGEKIKKTKQVILANGVYSLSDIVKNPACLGLSIEKRFKPRFRVLELLEAKKLLESWPWFWKFCSLKNKEFFDTYVGPFVDEIGDVYAASASDSKLK